MTRRRTGKRVKHTRAKPGLGLGATGGSWGGGGGPGLGSGSGFFFQAEDGIRDTSVTGVQTCALPISSLAPGVTGDQQGHGTMVAGVAAGSLPNVKRSEERRVGKERKRGGGRRREKRHRQGRQDRGGRRRAQRG